MTRRQRGFTLIEVVIALTIVATLLVIMFSGLRVGLLAWQRGDERAETLERTRSITQIITRTLGAAYPYQASATRTERARLLFDGEPGRVAFVTAAAPFPGADPVAFTAVTLTHSTSPRPGLAVTQKVLPNEKPFDGALTPLLVDGAVSEVRFRYLKESNGEWTDSWDGARDNALPVAIEVTLTVLRAGEPVEQPPLVVSVPVSKP